MKAGTKMARQAQKRSIHHNAALAAASKKSGKGTGELSKSMKSPGSMNKKKIGAC